MELYIFSVNRWMDGDLGEEAINVDVNRRIDCRVTFDNLSWEKSSRERVMNNIIMALTVKKLDVSDTKKYYS